MTGQDIRDLELLSSVGMGSWEDTEARTLGNQSGLPSLLVTPKTTPKLRRAGYLEELFVLPAFPG